ncbi:MAG: hypothetical protein ACI87E_000980 [Mariniblastus sp.]|jgi:hypothetical protein
MVCLGVVVEVLAKALTKLNGKCETPWVIAFSVPIP